MTSANGLICFTNCLQPLEDGSLVEKDLWIDERRGVVLDAQSTFFLKAERPERIIDLGGNILSPGFLDIQINGAYGFDFSVYDGNEDGYRKGMKTVAERIIETGVTSLVPTIITQEKSLYPTLLRLLRPFSSPTSATLLGWHAEGPFLDLAKRGAHPPPFLLSAPHGYETLEAVYGPENLSIADDWMIGGGTGVRMITVAPEITGIMSAIPELSKRGIVVSIGHSIAMTDVAMAAVHNGARLITHLFNAMPQLHHRDPSIIGLLGASPHLSPIAAASLSISALKFRAVSKPTSPTASEAFDYNETPPQTPIRATVRSYAGSTTASTPGSRTPLHLEKGQVADMSFTRPFYGIIVDGIHSHPNSVRLAHSVHPDGCVLITDAMKILDPNLKDGIHEWRDGKKFLKEGDKVYLEGTNTLAGSVVTLDKCVRNLSRFTGCSLGEAIKCATYNPAKCLGIENKKGTLRPGADADLVVLDREGEVLSTWIKGKELWKRHA